MNKLLNVNMHSPQQPRQTKPNCFYVFPELLNCFYNTQINLSQIERKSSTVQFWAPNKTKFKVKVGNCLLDFRKMCRNKFILLRIRDTFFYYTVFLLVGGQFQCTLLSFFYPISNHCRSLCVKLSMSYYGGSGLPYGRYFHTG